MATTSIGICELCGQTARKTAMTKHVVGCAATQDRKGPPETLVHLRVEASGAPEYWLHIEARASASFQQLDTLLRAVWLECCGHMSAFRVGRLEVSKRSSLGSLVGQRGAFDYHYDFGSTTALKGKTLGFRQGGVVRPAVRVLARNAPLPWRCAECAAAAEVICPNCVDSNSCLFCSMHAPAHPCADDEMWMPIVNSPRMGVCGYTGAGAKRSA
jgi:hypothetical protein